MLEWPIGKCQEQKYDEAGQGCQSPSEGGFTRQKLRPGKRPGGHEAPTATHWRKVRRSDFSWSSVNSIKIAFGTPGRALPSHSSIQTLPFPSKYLILNPFTFVASSICSTDSSVRLYRFLRTNRRRRSPSLV